MQLLFESPWFYSSAKSIFSKDIVAGCRLWRHSDHDNYTRAGDKLLHYFVALNMLHSLTLLNFLIYIRGRISLLKITIERLSWY